MRKILYALLCVACFGAGAYLWRVKSAGFQPAPKDQAAAPGSGTTPAKVLAPDGLAPQPSIVVEVGAERITQDDVDWEYSLATEGVFDKETLTPIPDLGNRYHTEMAGLKKSLIGTVVERKLLFAFVQQDRDFQYDKASRYTACMTEWQQAVEQPLPQLQGKGRDRLKARLCEKSILEQYLKERLFASIKVEGPEALEYYKNHMNEFRQSERVEIRQLLVGSESAAKKLRGQINARNFSDMAKMHSLAPEAENGGHLGPFAKGAMPAVFEVAFHLKKGEISDVVKSNYGYHLIMLLEKWPKTELSFDEAKPRIVRTLKRQKEEEAYSRWVEKALAAINVRSPKPVW